MVAEFMRNKGAASIFWQEEAWEEEKGGIGYNFFTYTNVIIPSIILSVNNNVLTFRWNCW
jgi:hypothetical protein